MNSDYEKYGRDKMRREDMIVHGKRIRDKYVAGHPFCEKCHERRSSGSSGGDSPLSL